MTATRFDDGRPLYKPPPKVDKARKRLNRRTRERMKDDAEYNAMRDIYLEQNPNCEMCGGIANQVHHICSGTAGRAASLLNPNTWLGLCPGCHRKCQTLNFQTQVMTKLRSVREINHRLKT